MEPEPIVLLVRRVEEEYDLPLDQRIQRSAR